MQDSRERALEVWQAAQQRRQRPQRRAPRCLRLRLRRTAAVLSHHAQRCHRLTSQPGGEGGQGARAELSKQSNQLPLLAPKRLARVSFQFSDRFKYLKHQAPGSMVLRGVVQKPWSANATGVVLHGTEWRSRVKAVQCPT